MTDDFEVCATPPCPAEMPGAWAAPGFSFMGACAVGAGCFSFMGACAVGVGEFRDTLPGWWSVFPRGAFWSVAAAPGAPWLSFVPCADANPAPARRAAAAAASKVFLVFCMIISNKTLLLSRNNSTSPR